MLKQILLAAYVLVGAVIFCRCIHGWHDASEDGLDFSEVFTAFLLAVIWPIPAPFWIWFKIDDYLWKKEHGGCA